jgi:hypothetical protein
VKYEGLYEFTPEGMNTFQRVFVDEVDEDAFSPTDPAMAKRIAGTAPFEVRDFATSWDMAAAIIAAMGKASITELLKRPEVWAWLAYALRDVVYPRRKDGTRKLGEIHRWFPSDLADYQKGQRHLIRMPVLLQHSFGDDARHLLLGNPSVPGEVREQLTSQQDMFNPAFQAAARRLYLDPKTGKLRKGSGGKKGGSARRLAQVRKQLDVTWDLFALSPAEILNRLPAEFDFLKVGLTVAATVSVADAHHVQAAAGGQA